MKILVIDRDTLASQTVRNKLELKGHKVTEETVKNAALEQLEKENFDAVFFDPAPLANARPLILGIRRSMRGYPYIALMSHDTNLAEAIKAGANGWLPKPLTADGLQGVVDDADRLITLVRRMGDESEDFPSAGGVIAKSAFNQLFLSAIDRADRYGERSFLVFIGVRNDKALRDQGGPYAADYAAAKLSQYLVRLRRQSDIIAQTGRAEYCLFAAAPGLRNRTARSRQPLRRGAGKAGGYLRRRRRYRRDRRLAARRAGRQAARGACHHLPQERAQARLIAGLLPLDDDGVLGLLSTNTATLPPAAKLCRRVFHVRNIRSRPCRPCCPSTRTTTLFPPSA